MPLKEDLKKEQYEKYNGAIDLYPGFDQPLGAREYLYHDG